jgi:hypothetical protein
LKLLEGEALLMAEPRRGYRVMSRTNDPDKGCPMAFVLSSGKGEQLLGGPILRELQAAAGRRGWSLLGVMREGRTSGEIVEHLRTARVCGVIVDSIDPELLGRIELLGLPTVMVDAWREDVRLDAVMQDGFAGGMLAGDYLAARGHRRVAFCGPELAGATPQIVERFGGAVSGLARGGAGAVPEFVGMDMGRGFAGAVARARGVLERSDRPTGILALWQGIGRAVANAAVELGMIVGRDFDMVGWSTEDDYRAEQETDRHPEQMPPAVVWSVAELAELCIVRLMQRRADPKIPVALTRVPVRLRTSS